MKVGICAQRSFMDRASFKMSEYETPQSVLDVCIKHQVTPIILPITFDSMVIEELVDMVDGIIITGGSDVAPELYGEEPIEHRKISCMPTMSPQRDDFEIKLIHIAWQKKKPILGLCRGLQVINVAFGGTLYQDLGKQFTTKKEPIEHFQNGKSKEKTHSVIIKPESVFADHLPRKTMVNSYHHQAIKQLGNELMISAKSPDGLIEAIEADGGVIRAVQWHPEQLWSADEKQESLFSQFFEKMHATQFPKRIAE